MTDVLDATHVAPKTTTDVFVVMCRYGSDYWSACTTWKTLDDAVRSVDVSDTVQAWKIVQVSGLPLGIPDGEAETPNNQVQARRDHASENSTASKPSPATEGSA